MSTPRPASPDPRVLYWIPALLAGALGAWVARTWAARIRYPFDLEWMEGGMLAHAWRVQQGLPLYPDAGADWLPYVYPPGYAALLALLGQGGLDYPVGRAISIAGTLLAAACLAFAVGRRAGWGLGLACAGMFLGCYPSSGAFYDLVRPDGLAIGLLALAVTVGVERWRRAPELAGIVLFLAFVVKHHSAAFGFAFAAAFYVRGGWREAARFGLASAVPGALFTLAMQVASEGHFLTWLLAVPGSHPIVAERILPGTPLEIGKHLGGAVVVCAASFLAAGGRRGALLGAALGAGLAGATLAIPVPKGIDAAPMAIGALCAAAVGAGAGGWLSAVARRGADWRMVLAGGLAVVGWAVPALMRGHNGGFVNVFVPLHWLLVAGFGFAAANLYRERPGWARAAAVAGIASVQLGWQLRAFEPHKLVPTPADVQAGAGVVALLRERCRGPILSPYAAWLPYQAGRDPSWHLIALWDIQHRGGPYYKSGLPRIAEAAREHRWACVVEGGSPRIGAGVLEQYGPGFKLDLPPKALQPKTGWRVRPSGVLVPKEIP